MTFGHVMCMVLAFPSFDADGIDIGTVTFASSKSSK